jgi:hypothetical protein
MVAESLWQQQPNTYVRVAIDRSLSRVPPLPDRASRTALIAPGSSEWGLEGSSGGTSRLQPLLSSANAATNTPAPSIQLQAFARFATFFFVAFGIGLVVAMDGRRLLLRGRQISRR